ncbi:MAG: carboxypeptidase regulatory-like domain-containing protein [bacterium]|nr:carboxypeptidase regulatory-like domain-containing protein [bacterium]
MGTHRAIFGRLVRRLVVTVGTLAAAALSAVATAREIEISGQLVTATGEGLANATIELLPLEDPWQIARDQLRGDLEPRPAVSARCRRDGTFQLAAPARGMWKLVARHPGRLTAARELRPLLEGRELPPVVLLPRSEIAVRVTDAAGQPVAGLRLLADGRATAGRAEARAGAPDPWRAARRQGWRLEPRTAVTGEDGGAVLAAYPAETLTVAAVAEGRFLYQSLDAGTETAELRFFEPLTETRLLSAVGPPASAIIGAFRRPFLAIAVSDSDGAIRLPADAAGRVLDAEVLEPIVDAWVWTAGGYRRTDRDGTFSLRLPADRPGRLGAAAPGYGRARIRITADDLADDEPRDVGLQPILTLQGTVLDVDRLPIAGARVELEDSLWPAQREQETVTGTDGRFELTGLGPVSYFLTASVEGYAAGGLTRIRPSADEDPTDVGNVILHRAHTLTGRVTDSEDRSLDGVRIRVLQMDPRPLANRATPETTTRDDGTFQLDGLPPATTLMLGVSHEGFQDATVSTVRSDREEPLLIVLLTGVVVSVRVVDATGAPARASAELERRTTWTSSRHLVETDDHGRCSFAGQAPGAATLSARSDDSRSDTLQLTLVADRAEVEVTLVLNPGAAIAGRVSTPDGDAVEKVYVRVEELRSGPLVMGSRELRDVSDAEGRFRIGGLDAGRFRLEAGHPDFERLTEVVELAPGATAEVELRFRQRRRRPPVSGQVVGPGGQGLAGAGVRLMPGGDGPKRPRGSLVPPGPGMATMAQAVSRTGGAFELAAPREGSFSILVSHPDFAALRTETFPVGEAGVEGLFLQLEAGGSLRGEVLGIGEDDLRRVHVSARAPGFGTRAGEIAGAGLYEISNLPAGHWQVNASLDSPMRSAEGRIMLGPDEHGTLDLRFEAGYRLNGLALSGGEPIAGSYVTLTCREPHFHARMITGAAGGFVIEGVPGTTCDLLASDPRTGANGRRELAIDSDAEVVIEISPVDLAGQVLSAGEMQPVAGARLRLRFAGGPNTTVAALAESDAGGRFDFAAVNEGSYVLRAERPGFASRDLELHLDGPRRDLQVLLEAAVPATLFVRLEDGSAPRYVTVEMIDPPTVGSAQIYQLELHGRLVLETLAPGSWRLLIRAGDESGKALVEVPGPPVEVTLAHP